VWYNTNGRALKIKPPTSTELRTVLAKSGAGGTNTRTNLWSPTPT
jgi:hypothetical protein